MISFITAVYDRYKVSVKKEAMFMKFFPRTTSFFDDAFDDVFAAPFFRNTSDATMKTDITEKDGNYLLDIELPGCKKEDIKMELDDGYLSVMASRNTSSEEKDDKGNIIRQERFSGTFQRSFYVGEGIREDDIKATYDNGELKIIVPKQEAKLPEKKYISID